VKQKINSNEGLNLDAHDEKPIFVNYKKRQQSADISSGARTGGGHELEKELCPRVVASKPTGQSSELKDNVPTSFNKISRHSIKAIGRRKKMVWVPKGSAPIKAELITRTSTTRPTLKSEPHMTSKLLLSKHTNKKANPWGHNWAWSYNRHPRDRRIASEHQDH
jgi:hypothetical protein